MEIEIPDCDIMPKRQEQKHTRDKFVVYVFRFTSSFSLFSFSFPARSFLCFTYVYSECFSAGFDLQIHLHMYLDKITMGKQNVFGGRHDDDD